MIATKDTSGFRLETCESAFLQSIYRDRRLPMEDGGTKPLDVYIPPEQGDYLYSLIRHYRPATTVEIGMANGLSSVYMAQAIHDNGEGRHIAIDPFQTADWQGTGVGLLRLAGLSQHVRLIEDFSHQALPALEREGTRAQLIFIDGAHLTDYVMADFLVSDRILDVGGLIAFDDSDWDAVRIVLRYILANRHYEVAHPEVVIEPMPYTPRLGARLLRGVARAVPPLAGKLRPDFLATDPSLGIRGRCVVIRKLADDDRNSQNRAHHRDF